jgi:hypothetical protein
VNIGKNAWLRPNGWYIVVSTVCFYVCDYGNHTGFIFKGNETPSWAQLYNNPLNNRSLLFLLNGMLTGSGDEDW